MKKILLLLILLAPFSVQGHISKNDFRHHNKEPIRILLVPGHDNDIYGTKFGNMKEADLNVQLAKLLFDHLSKDSRFKVFTTRDESSYYTEEFTKYFTEQRKNIIAFKEKAKKKANKKIEKYARKNKSKNIKKGARKSVRRNVSGKYVMHPQAKPEASIKLHGINKWSQENKMDAIIHIHFNDHPGRKAYRHGKYTGFTIYYPDNKLINSGKSVNLARAIFRELKKGQKVSSHPQERHGLTRDRTLIAMGSNNTLSKNNSSVLIEYGYIYEKKLQEEKSRSDFLSKMAELTYTGIHKHFYKKD